MLQLATQIAKGQKELNNEAIKEMINANIDKAHKLLTYGYDKNKTHELMTSILKIESLVKLVMDEAVARLNGLKAMDINDYITK